MATRTKYPRVHVVIKWAEFGLLDDLAGKPITVEQFNVLASAASSDAPEGGGYNKIKMNVYVDGEDTLEMRHDADRRGSEGRGLRQLMERRLANSESTALDSEASPRGRDWARQAVPVYRSVLEALTSTGNGAADRTPRRKTSAHTTKKTRTRSAPKKPNRQATPKGISRASSADVSALGLNAVLAQLGYTTEPGRQPGTKDVRRNSNGMLARTDATAAEIWAWLRGTNQIPQTDELARMPRLKIGDALDHSTDSKRFYPGLVIQNPAGNKTFKVQKMGADGDVLVSELRKNGTWIKKAKELPESWLRYNFPSQGYRVIADPAPGKAAKKASRKVSKTTAKKTPAKKRARAKGDDEIRLYKRSGKLIATYGVSYKLTQAMESIRDCARKGTPCKLSTVIKAYEQLRNAARSPGKSPRQGLAYYIAAELAKDLRRSDELEAVGKGDHPRIKEA